MSKGPIKLVPAGGNKEMFNERPIRLPGWELRHNAAVPIGKPSEEDTTAALDFATNTKEVSPYWVGDIAAHVESRIDWQEKVDQILHVRDYEVKTISNLASMCRRVAQRERDISPSVEHSKIVAKLPVADQRKWLSKSRTEGWGKRDLTLELQASEKRGVVSGTADLEGMFHVWSIDYPWVYGDAAGMSRQRSHYPGLPIDKGIKMGDQIKAHCTKHAVAFFWVTAPMLYYASDGITPDPYRLITSWGFEPKTGGVWDKVEHNFGNYLSVRHEHLIIATRGSCTPDRPTPMFDSVFTERKSDTHSEKPESIIKMIERLYDGPYVEIFARRRRKGWTCWGNQVNGDVKKAG